MRFEVEQSYETKETGWSETGADTGDAELTEADFEECYLDEVQEADEYNESYENDQEGSVEDFEDCFEETDEYYDEGENQEDVDFEDCGIEENDKSAEEADETGEETEEAAEETDETTEETEEAVEETDETGEETEEAVEETDETGEETEELVKKADETAEEAEEPIEKNKEVVEEAEEAAEEAEETAEEAEEAAEEVEDTADEAKETAEAVEETEELSEETEEIEETFEEASERAEEVKETAEEVEESINENDDLEYRSQILEEPTELEKLEKNQEKHKSLEQEREEIQSRVDELNKECGEKFCQLETMSRDEPGYKDLLREYNETRDQAAQEFEKLSEKDSELADIRAEEAELKGIIDKRAREAMENASANEEIASSLHNEYEILTYNEGRDIDRMNTFVKENTLHIEKLKDDMASVEQAIELKNKEMAEFHQRYGERINVMSLPEYRRLINEQKELEQCRSNLDYRISELETDRMLMERQMEDAERRPTIRERVSSFFGGLIQYSKAEEAGDAVTAEQEGEDKFFEEVSEEAEKNTAERLEKLKGMDISEMNERQKQELIDISVEAVLAKYGGELSDNRIEKIRNSIEFVGPDTIARDTGVADPSNILGYYSSDSDKIKINISPGGSSGDAVNIAATIDHECLHMISQNTNHKGKAVGYITGLKDRNCEKGNVGMNEGVTELYSIRNVHSYAPEYTSEAYVDEVEIMEAFEEACGKELMCKAYINHDVELLRNDFDGVMGSGSFSSFCNQMDNMHENIICGNKSGADRQKKELLYIVKNYRDRKGENE